MKLQQVAGLHHGGLFQHGQAAHVGQWVDDAAAHPFQQRVIVALDQQVGWQAPHVRKALVAVANAAREVGDQNAVGGRFECGRQLCGRHFQRALRVHLLAAVVQGHHVQARVPACARHHSAHSPHHRHGAAIKAAHQRFGFDAVAHAIGHLTPEAQFFGGGRKLQHLLAQQVGGRHPQQLTGCKVGTDDAQCLCIHQPHRVQHRLDQPRHALQRVGGVGQPHRAGTGFHEMVSSSRIGSKKYATRRAGAR